MEQHPLSAVRGRLLLLLHPQLEDALFRDKRDPLLMALDIEAESSKSSTCHVTVTVTADCQIEWVGPQFI